MQNVMQRRVELLVRIDAQRVEMAQSCRRLKAPLSFADQGLAILRYLRSHPVLVAGVVALVVAKRNSMDGLMSGAWGLWKGYRYVAMLATKLL